MINEQPVINEQPQPESNSLSKTTSIMMFASGIASLVVAYKSIKSGNVALGMCLTAISSPLILIGSAGVSTEVSYAVTVTVTD